MITDILPHPAKPETDAGMATAEQGIVLLDGPKGVAVSLSPEATEQSGLNLIIAAAAAQQQRGEVIGKKQ